MNAQQRARARCANAFDAENWEVDQDVRGSPETTQRHLQSQSLFVPFLWLCSESWFRWTHQSNARGTLFKV